MAFSEDIAVTDMQSVIDNIVSFATTNAGFTLHNTIANAIIVGTDSDAYTDLSILSKVNQDITSEYAISSVTDNGVIARFNFTGPTLEVDDFVIVEDFVVNTAYNGEFYVTATDGTTYFETGVSFGSNETGNFLDGAYKMYYYLYADTVSTEPDDVPAGDIGSLNCRMMITEPTSINFNDNTINGQRYKTRTSTWGNLDGGFNGLNLYTDGNAVHVVLEVYDNVFAQLSFGKVDKLGSWIGGEYVTANNIRDYDVDNGFYFFDPENSIAIFSYGAAEEVSLSISSSYLYRPSTPPTKDFYDWALSVDEFSGTGVSEDQIVFFSGYRFATASLSFNLQRFSPNTFNQRAMLIPMYVLSTDEFINPGQTNFAGFIPSVKYLDIELLNPKDIVDVNWRVYPYCSKEGDPFTAPITANHGLAYRRV